ncbi:MAG: BlaI/MecI/CopY family transcriptional regulator [Bacteroidales bacterium]|nr:BlaI/MecI/CopY family transcriptional regulator [Bacteroidales bacterium]
MSQRLTKAEEEIMLIMWRLKEAIVRDVIENLNDPDTPYTTVSTVIRILEKKGFVGHRAVGTTHLYYPLLSKKEYLKGYLTGIVKNYFDGSSSNLVTFFAKESDMSLEELKSLIEEVESELEKEDKNGE